MITKDPSSASVCNSSPCELVCSRLWSVGTGLHVADKRRCSSSPLSSGTTVRVWHRFILSLVSQTVCLIITCHLSAPLLGHFKTPAWGKNKQKKKDETVASWAAAVAALEMAEMAPIPALPFCLGWVREDRCRINTLWIIWQVLSTRRAPTCALYLDYRLSGCPEDLTCIRRTQWSLGRHSRALIGSTAGPIISSPLAPSDSCIVRG